MTILSSQSIRKRCEEKTIAMIEPFKERTVSQSGMTFGLSGASYDVRIDQSLTLFPGDCKLASTSERFNIPNDVVAMVADKSTWARRFLTVQHTLIDPGFRGFVTLELVNHSALAIDIARGDPIAQIIFHRLDEPTNQPYRGKYQNQAAEPVLPMFDAYGDYATAPDWPEVAHKYASVPNSIERSYEQLVPDDPHSWTPIDMTPRPGEKIPGFRFVHPQVIEEGDPSVTIYIGNKQIGYVTDDKLWLIGADNRASEICDVTDEGILPALLAQHYRAI